MATTFQDLTVILEDKPGTFAQAAEVIAEQGINLEGASSINCGGEGIFHALVKTEQDAAAAKRALEKAGFTVRAQQPVVVVEVQDRPGEGARILRAIADAQVNIEFSYIAANTRLVIGSKNPQKVAQSLGSIETSGTRR